MESIDTEFSEVSLTRFTKSIKHYFIIMLIIDFFTFIKALNNPYNFLDVCIVTVLAILVLQKNRAAAGIFALYWIASVVVKFHRDPHFDINSPDFNPYVFVFLIIFSYFIIRGLIAVYKYHYYVNKQIQKPIKS